MLAIDQVIKIVVKTNMSLYDKIEITSWFQIFFTENHGMAFGMDFIGTSVLAVLRLGAIIFFFFYLAKLIRRAAPKGFLFCFSLIIAGALGNIVDNAIYGLVFTESLPFGAVATCTALGKGYGTFLGGHVVDMFYFPLFVWPDSLPLLGGKTFFNAVFNFADAAISCGAAAMFVGYYRYINEHVFKSKN